MKDWTGEIDKHVSDGVNKLLTEDKCDLTAQEELSTDQAKELADYLNPRLFDTGETCDASETCDTSETRLMTRLRRPSVSEVSRTS